MSFDWRTEEEGAWTPEPERPRPPAGRTRRRPILIGLLLLAIAAAIVTYFYREAVRRIAATEETVTGDVLASHELVALAGRSADPELLRTVLSGADQTWAQAQARRVQEGGAAGLAYLGLEPLPPETQPEVALDPELRSAELSWAAPFVVTGSTGITQTIHLTQTAIYRRGSSNWLLAPPRPDYWGGSDEYRGTYVEAIFAERDEETARRLAAGLDDLLARLCSRHQCPAGFRYRLIFSTDPASFEQINAHSLLIASRTLTLPTPLLVGLPVDEAAYEALARGYGVLLSTAALAQIANYDCCQRNLYALAWIHRQQHQMGLRSWPLDAAAYDRLLLEMPPEYELPRLLEANGLGADEAPFASWATAYAWAQFLEEVYHPELAAAAVGTPVGPLLEQGGLAEQNVTRAFIRYIYEHSGRAGAEPPLTGTVALTCSTGNGATLLRTYDLATGRWQTLYEDPLPFDPSGLNYSYAEPLGNRNGLIVVTRRTTVDENGASLASFTLQLAIPGSGITTTLLSSSAASWEELPRYRSFRFGHDPQGRYLVLADYNPGRGLSPGRYNFALVDLRGCNGATCPIEPLPGPITWSPDGAAALVVSDGPQLSEWPWQRPELSVGDAGASDLTPLENASVAVWLDSSHFAYITAYGARDALVVRALPGNAQLLRVPLPELWQLAGQPDPLIPSGANLAGLSLVPHPGGSRQFLVSVGWMREGYPGELALFLVQLDEARQELLSSRFLGADMMGASISGSGRWLLRYPTRNPHDGILLDLNAPPDDPAAVRSLPLQHQALGWVTGSDWLVLNGNSHLLIYNPSEEATHFIPFEDESCFFTTWLEP
jgi:hypothetical protein